MTSNGNSIIFPLLIIASVFVGVLVVIARPHPPTPILVSTLTPSPVPSPTTIPTATPTPLPNIIELPTSKPVAGIPQLHPVTVGGFAFEDRNNDGIYNSDDTPLQYMQFYLYDSYNPSLQLSTLYSDAQGKFSLTLEVHSGIIIKPSASNNFHPGTNPKTIKTSTTTLNFAFRSGSAPVAGVNIGIIEGKIFQDSNRNNIREGSESGVYYYPLYLVDSKGNYYNTTENSQTTDPSGHFKFQNLPVSETYRLQLMNTSGEYESSQAVTTISLSSTQPQKVDLEIPVYRY